MHAWLHIYIYIFFSISCLIKIKHCICACIYVSENRGDLCAEERGIMLDSSINGWKLAVNL
jgi:hypothetical protein